MNSTTNPTTSFFGKCVTVLIGMALSYATMTNPQIEQLARHFFGQTSSSDTAMLGEEPFEEPALTPFVEPAFSPAEIPATLPNVEVTPTQAKPKPSLQNFAVPPAATPRNSVARLESVQPAISPNLNDEQRIKLASQTLRELGATYLRLEKLTTGTDERFRVRCDLAGETERVKCCYEATRESAVDAMEDVLHAVREGVADDNTTKVASSG